MKILQVHNEYIYRGGEETVLEAEKELLTRNGHAVYQIIRSNKIEIKNLFDVFRTLSQIAYSKKSLNILEKKIDQIDLPDIVHIHNIFPLWTYSVIDYFNKKNIPIVMTLHNYRLIWDTINFFDKEFSKFGLFKNSRILTYIVSRIFNKKKKLIKNVDKFITFTNFTRNKILRSGLSKSKIEIKPNFLVNKFKKNKPFSKKENAIYASRISKEKGVITLLQAWNDIDLKLKIYGDGPLFEFCKKNQNQKINFHGNKKREYVNKKISNSKMLIFPSEWYECMPMTILEAFNEGTLVIASNIGSISNIIKNFHNGILFEPGNPNDLNKKVKWALKNPIQCNKIANNAKKIFLAKYSENVNYKSLISIYRNTIKQKKL
ncbi:MAG: glycosyltransferase family 4 protein [Candidatus Pelagibacter sp.]